jgi:predicted GIY-YIG superfamily endonuclease
MASAPADSEFFVYILRCIDGSLYVGHTADLQQRVKDHNDGIGASWTACRRPIELVYSEPAAHLRGAIRRESQLKGWTHAKKLALVRGDLTHLKALSRRRVR